MRPEPEAYGQLVLDADRIEDLEEALRKIALVLGQIIMYPGIDREHAALNIALDVLNLDEAPPTYQRAKCYGRRATDVA